VVIIWGVQHSWGAVTSIVVIIWGVQHSWGAVTSIVVSIWGVQHSRGLVTTSKREEPRDPLPSELLLLLLYSRSGPRRSLSLKLSDTRVYEP